MNEELPKEFSRMLINNIRPAYTITMRRPDNSDAGQLDFNGPKLIFTGDAEESAKIFINWLSIRWEQRLQEEREAEREACAKLAGPHLGGEIAAAIRARGET